MSASVAQSVEIVPRHPNKNPLASWRLLYPPDALGPPAQIAIYELRVPNGFYHYNTMGSRYSYLAFFHPDKTLRWFGENFTPEEAATIGDLRVETPEGAQALVEALRGRRAS